VHEANKSELVLAHALSNFTKAERKWLEPLLQSTAEALPLLLNKGGAEYLTALALSGKE
jgi:peptidyl-tRNA hydrolase